MKDLKPYQFRIPVQLLAWLQTKADREHTTVSELIRRCLVNEMLSDMEQASGDQRVAG